MPRVITQVLWRVVWIVAVLAADYSFIPVDHAAGTLHVLQTSLDRALPFIPLTILLLVIFNFEQFKVFALAFIITSLAAALFQRLYPTVATKEQVLASES